MIIIISIVFKIFKNRIDSNIEITHSNNYIHNSLEIIRSIIFFSLFSKRCSKHYINNYQDPIIWNLTIFKIIDLIKSMTIKEQSRKKFSAYQQREEIVW